MKIRINDSSAAQLLTIMQKTGYDNVTHCLQTMISQVLNNMNKQSHKSPQREDSKHDQPSKNM